AREIGTVGLGKGGPAPVAPLTPALAPLRGEGDAPFVLVAGYRFLKPDFQLVARVEAVQSQVEAVVNNAVHIGFEQVNISAQVDYVIKKAGVFSLRLALPDG